MLAFNPSADVHVVEGKRNETLTKAPKSTQLSASNYKVIVLSVNGSVVRCVLLVAEQNEMQQN